MELWALPAFLLFIAVAFRSTLGAQGMTFARSHQEWQEKRAAEREAHMQELCIRNRSIPSVTYEGGTRGEDVKLLPQRNRHLLDMARGMPCLLLVPGCCNHRLDTTVACHSNLSIHGKSGARKADDQYSVQGCFACHTWLDSGPAPQAQKTAVFMAALGRQRLAWGDVAADPGRPEGDRRAARWALERLALEAA